jgi:hypothetical protein
MSINMKVEDDEDEPQKDKTPSSVRKLKTRRLTGAAGDGQ